MKTTILHLHNRPAAAFGLSASFIFYDRAQIRPRAHIVRIQTIAFTPDGPRWRRLEIAPVRPNPRSVSCGGRGRRGGCLGQQHQVFGCGIQCRGQAFLHIGTKQARATSGFIQAPALTGHADTGPRLSLAQATLAPQPAQSLANPYCCFVFAHGSRLTPKNRRYERFHVKH